MEKIPLNSRICVTAFLATIFGPSALVSQAPLESPTVEPAHAQWREDIVHKATPARGAFKNLISGRWVGSLVLARGYRAYTPTSPRDRLARAANGGKRQRLCSCCARREPDHADGRKLSIGQRRYVGVRRGRGVVWRRRHTRS